MQCNEYNVTNVKELIKMHCDECNEMIAIYASNSIAINVLM